MSKENTEAERDSAIKGLFKLGAHFGFSRARRHPSVAGHIFGYKNKTAVIDLEQTVDGLARAKAFVKKIATEGKQLLLVGNKNEAQPLIKTYAEAVGLPYVAERWIGGTFTNFKQIRSRIDKMKDYRAKEKAGELSVYTKRERTQMAIEMAKVTRFFAGIETLERLPGAIFVIDSAKEHSAVAEARKLRIPVVGLASSDCDINLVDYPIVANDTAKASIEYFIDQIAQAYREGKLAAQTEAKAKADALAAAPAPTPATA